MVGVTMTDYELSKESLLRQILLAICSSLGCLGIGLIRGFTSPGIPSMERTSPHLLLDSQTNSWITSIPPLGSMIGGLVAMPWMHYMGRKRVLQIVGPLFSLAWIGIALSENTTLLIMSRFGTGFAAGIASPCSQIYVCECSHPKIRGLLASLPSVIVAGGVVVQFMLRFVLEWRGMAWVSAIFPAALALVLVPFPESPPWLKLNGKKSSVEAYEWYGIKTDLECYSDKEDKYPDEVESEVKIQIPFCSRGVIIPLSLALAVVIFQHTCGNDVVIYNAATIFRSSGSTIDIYMASFILALFQIAFAFLSIFLVDKYGRKRLLITAAFIMGVSIGCLSLYFYLHENGKASHLTYLPLISLMVYIAAFSLGLCTVPYILIGEIFPLAYRSILGPLTISIGLLAMFIELKTYSTLLYYFREGGAFAFYSFLNFFAVAFTYFFLPETKGKSLEEIEFYFSRTKQISKRKHNI